MATGQDQTDFDALHEALFLAAALVEDFDPRVLLAEVWPKGQKRSIVVQGKLMSALREVSQIDGKLWRMRSNARRSVLEGFTEKDGLPETEIGMALKGADAFAADHLQGMIEQSPALETLSSTVATLEKAGPSAPGHRHLMALSSKLERARQDEATDTLLGDGFVGRGSEVTALLSVLDAPQWSGPLQTLHIRGLPGVGKTFLLEHLARRVRSQPEIVMVRLDFDQSGLRDGAVDAVFVEISRQIGNALPHVAAELHRLRVEAAERQIRIGAESEPQVPYDLLQRMLDILQEGGYQLLLLLDTLEVLDAQGATFVGRLLRHIDLFADKERIAISVISAGRGPIFDEGDTRLSGLIPLEKLDQDVTREILRKRKVPPSLWPQIIDLSKGNPLMVILVTRALLETESEDRLGPDEITQAENGYLYRAVLSRVPLAIRDIAAFGLILPEVGIEELMMIIAPALNQSWTAQEAADLLDLLEAQRWLVTTRGPRRFAHVEEIRAEILELIYTDNRAETAAINTRAAEFWASSDPARALYHQLQLWRVDHVMPDIRPDLAVQLDEVLLVDLPTDVQDAVRRARGQRAQLRDSPDTSKLAEPSVGIRLAQSGSADPAVCVQADPTGASSRMSLVAPFGAVHEVDAGAMADLRNMLGMRERGEASHLLTEYFQRPFLLDSDAGLLALTHQWQSGHWSMAKTMFDRLPQGALDRALDQDMELTGLTLLEMWAEFRFDRLCARMKKDRGLVDAVEFAVNLTQRSGFRDGALAFAQIAVGGSENARSVGSLGVIAPHLFDYDTGYANEQVQRAAAMRKNYGMSFDPTLIEDEGGQRAEFAQRVAPLNPYADPMRALIEELSRQQNHKAVADIAALGAGLADLGRMFAPTVWGVEMAQGRAGSWASETVTLMDAVGLTAELATGYSFFSPIADLPTIARGAARWQQATLGLWAYGRSQPARWTDAPEDALVAGRIAQVHQATDPVQEAFAMLRIWDDPQVQPRGKPSAILGRRLAKRYTSLRGLKGQRAQLDYLRDCRVPAVLQAPLVVLAQHAIPPKEIFQRVRKDLHFT